MVEITPENIETYQMRMGLKIADEEIISRLTPVLKDSDPRVILALLIQNVTDLRVYRYSIECGKHDVDKTEEELVSHGEKYTAYYDGNEWALIINNGFTICKLNVNKDAVDKILEKT